MLRMLGLHLAYTQGLHQFNEFKWESWTPAWQRGMWVHQPLPKALQEPRAAADAGPGCQTAEPSTRGFPVFQGDAEKQGQK